MLKNFEFSNVFIYLNSIKIMYFYKSRNNV